MWGQLEKSAEKKRDLSASIGRADRLSPASTVTSSSIAILIAAILGAGVTTGFQFGPILQTVTVCVAWISVVMATIRLSASATTCRDRPELLPDEKLPTYTVILPLFREAHMVEGLISALSQLNYPTHKLDIILACESVDPETVSAAQALAKPPFRVIILPPVVPGGSPQTKPRALNYALDRSSGALVTIFDAEDRPHPDQLRLSASAFHANPDWAALQAPLDYFNTRDSWLAAQFGLEYAGLFHVLLPFYDRLGLPFPLGGTSNHMRGLM